MIARLWRGEVATADADAYATYMHGTGVADYRATDGNLGVYMLRRLVEGSAAEFVMLTLWESLDAVKGFAGEDHERAIFYADDERYLLERDTRASHLDVVAATVPGDAIGASKTWELPGAILRYRAGWTRARDAEAYLEILGEDVLPGIAARIAGYNGAYVLRGDRGDEVQYVTLTLFDSTEAARELEGDDYETARVPAEERVLLTRPDERSVHYEVLAGGLGESVATIGETDVLAARARPTRR